MKEKLKYFAYLLVLATMLFSFSSCQNVFGSKTESSFVYGEWIYQKSNGSGIKLNLNEDGTYYYAEFLSDGEISYEFSSTFALTSNRLILRDLETENEEGTLRYNIFALSMKNSTENEDILDLVPKMTARYSFKRVGESKVVSLDKEISEIQGLWKCENLASIEISSDKISIKTESENIEAKYKKIDEGKLLLEFSVSGYDEYQNVEYFVRNNSLYVIFPSIGSDIVVFTSIS